MADIDTAAIRTLWAVDPGEAWPMTQAQKEINSLCGEIDRLREVVYGEDYPRLSALEARLAGVLALCDGADEFHLAAISAVLVRAAATGEADRG